MQAKDEEQPTGTFSELMAVENDAKTKEQKNVRTNGRSTGRTDGRRGKRTDGRTNVRGDADTITISVPIDRQKIRAGFDIFKDQKLSLDKLQLAYVDAGQERPKLGELVQEALDAYIEKKAKQLMNVRLRHHKS